MGEPTYQAFFDYIRAQIERHQVLVLIKRKDGWTQGYFVTSMETDWQLRFICDETVEITEDDVFPGAREAGGDG